MSGSSAPPAPNVGEELGGAINALNGNSGALVSAEQSIAPQVSQLNTQDNMNSTSQLANFLWGPQGGQAQATTEAEYLGNSYLTNQVGQVNQNIGGITSALNSSNPYQAPLASAAAQYMGTGEDSTLSNLTNIQANFGSSINPALNDISAASTVGQGALSAGMANSALLPGQQGPGALSAGTQQLVNTTSQQLALNGQISPEEQDMVSQASRAADSARGIFNSNASTSNELLNLDQYSQQRLVTQENQAATAQGLANSQLQNNVTNTQNAYTGASSIFNAGQTTSLSALTSGAALNLQGLNQASATQQAGLGLQYQQQNTGLSQLAYLASLGQSNTSSALNFIGTESGAGSQIGQNNINSMAGIPQANPQPTVFNGLGLFGASQDAANTAYNGQFAANEQNAQGQNALMGAGIAAGASIIGAVAL